MRKTYFASDFHLGVDARTTSRERERQLVQWLDFAARDAEAIYLVGDLFEFWFEYRSVVPKGFTRFLGKLAELRDAGLPLHVFTGNHDLWMFGYFQDELGIPVYHQSMQTAIGGKNFFIGHGDGLGPNDYGYKRMKKVFAHPAAQWLFRRIHPDWGAALARIASQTSRAAAPAEERAWMGDDREWLVQYCLRKVEQGVPADYFVFGHRHLPIDYRLPNGARYINLGEWLHACTYGVWDGEDMGLWAWTGNGGARLAPTAPTAPTAEAVG
ncbi:MAG: UDP-2,3-diacylglucosamine diphosphatase [Saprospiraceae bacterium]|nr:UDP-2,3-diacylglucosamine diphosphatase [Saprospiraceae bacterium]